MNIIVIKNNLMEKLANVSFEKIYEIFCLCYVFLYFIHIGDIIILAPYFRVIRGLFAVIAVTHILSLIIRKEVYRYLAIDIIFILIFFFIILLCSSNAEVENYIDTLILSISVLSIDYCKVMRSVALSFIISILGSFLFVFTNLVDCCAREYDRTYGGVTSTIIRSGWGFSHENILGMWCFIATVCFCIGFNNYSKILRGMLAFAVAVFVWIVPNSRFNSELLILFGLALFVDYSYDTFFNKKVIFVIIRKRVEVIALIIATIIPFLMMWAVVNYENINPDFLAILDKLASGRIYLAHKGYQDCGFSLWGQTYNGSWYLDSGWIRIPIVYGVPMMLMVLALFLYMGLKAYKKDDFLLVQLILLLSVTGICYELVIYLCYCVFLIVPFAKYTSVEKERKNIDGRVTDRLKAIIDRDATLLCSFVVLAIFIIFRKNIISILQTFIECKDYTRIILFSLILVFLFFMGMLVMGLSGFLKRRVIHVKNISVYLLPVSCIGLLFLFACSWYSINVLDKENIAYKEVIADEEAMNVLEKIQDVNVVSQVKPYLYEKCYDFIDLKWLPTADYARFDNITIILDARNNYRTFSHSGFLQTPISEYHKIYTNDSRVIEAMEAAGYSFTYYSQYVKELDLNQYAELNELEMTKAGSIFVKSSEEGIAITEKTSEDFVDVYTWEWSNADENGDYILHIVLQADVKELKDMSEETVIAHVLLQSSTAVFVDYCITSGEFNNGVAVCNIPYELKAVDDIRINTTFTIDEVNTLDFLIDEMSYYRTK